MSHFWDYLCHRCQRKGTCYIAPAMSMLNATHLVADDHATMSPDCHQFYQGRWIEIFRVRPAE